MVATDATSWTTTPTCIGSFPEGTSRPSSASDLHVEVVRQRRLDCRDRIGLVALDADHRPLHPQDVHHDAQAQVHPLGVFDHGAVIGGEVGFALATIQHHRVQRLILGGRELDVCWKGGAAQAHDPGMLDGLDDLGRIECGPFRDHPRPRGLG
jgi:hypothetical protein